MFVSLLWGFLFTLNREIKFVPPKKITFYPLMESSIDIIIERDLITYDGKDVGSIIYLKRQLHENDTYWNWYFKKKSMGLMMKTLNQSVWEQNIIFESYQKVGKKYNIERWFTL